MTTEKANTPVNPFIVAISVLLPSFLALAASSATNVCQPNIAGYYGATQYEANTVITCYIISGGLMLPVTGYLVQVIGKNCCSFIVYGFFFGLFVMYFSSELASTDWRPCCSGDWKRLYFAIMPSDTT